MHAYRSLATTVSIHFFIMFALTYAAVNSYEDIFVNINRFYMAAIMVAPMVLLMVVFMWDMYPKPVINGVLIIGSIAIFLLGFTAIRTQTLVNNTQFLRSMISHHSSAIVMCERSDITDQEIRTLCESIVRTQQEEITQMNAILDRLIE